MLLLLPPPISQSRSSQLETTLGMEDARKECYEHLVGRSQGYC